ncbi:GNAT family N-acetyltransferase [Streptomyces sp. NPDC004069]
MNYVMREYTPADETSWLRCRVLAFLDTSFYDAVVPSKPAVTPGLELVVVDETGAVVALMDTGIEGELATIDTVAVHPDHRRRGLGRQLLERTCAWASSTGAIALDAWTRDDADTLAWYRSMGFAESDHYLHVYAFYYTDPAEPARAIAEARPGLRPMLVFGHAPLADEERLRSEFARVHVDRRFAMPI